MSDSDEIPWPDLTSDDYAAIDKLCVQTETEKGAASIQVEVEHSIDDLLKETAVETTESPYTLFRRRGYLSVTDIVSPAWCEVQFDYGLRQYRFLPLKKRPKVFKSEKGKEIQVSVEVAKKNDKIIRGGRVVHKKLEKEVHKVEVAIPVQTPEEAWALRLLDTLVRLSVLKEKGVCRELRVWGILHNEPILGIIDEVQLGTNNLLSSPKRKRTTSSCRQTPIDHFFKPAASKKATSPDEKLIVKILDSKTRKDSKIPSHADTYPSRLQVMLYRRLLEQILRFEPTLFLEFCTRLNIYSDKNFSETFVGELSVFILDNDLDLKFLDATNLAKLLETYTSSIRDLARNLELSDSLSLVYRRRGKKKLSRKRLKTAKVTSDEQRDSCQPCVKEEVVGESAQSSATSSKSSSPESMQSVTGDSSKQNDDAVDKGVSPALFVSPRLKRKRRKSIDGNDAPQKDVTSDIEFPMSEEDEKNTYEIIGTKKFKYNESLLDKYLTSILLWWHGKREPRGVDIENVGRCNSCEYQHGCEWREKKALEFLSNVGSATKSGTIRTS